jgi:hypothetical protein
MGRYRAMFDLQKPLALADYRHALDTWQWSLRVDPQAGLEVQLAALLHDVERLVSETEQRIEQHAPDYPAFKQAHAHKGAEMTRALLLEQGADRAVAQRTSELVRTHEHPENDAELALLNDADALSFFSLNSAGYIDYFGREQTRRKIRYTLARMRQSARARLKSVRVSARVGEILLEEQSS